ncbi:response regulator [Nostoc sp. FACHB-152]|uniref:hybrid sensor histidine kinase/response regulator n=1 Tax=unclassified Nostoc TaxID=2593658 RepID=UPI0016878685|nr:MULTISPECIES: response regulator [unclassified Nostoc]MBD2446167.1 response regulator [Nostoc sp. FACHB-152]MBD2467399.1 response regulator [Nostoc sp. FACHB-145]
MINNSSNISNKKIKVLIVEDEYILAINLQESLESLGYIVVDIADSGEAAIEKANELHPNLILMDIRLRGEIDGIDAAEQIWEQLQIPVIYVTGHSDQSTVERATLTFPFGYILKPVREQELYVAIQTALNRYEREQFLSTVLKGMGDGVIVVDSQLQVKYMNQVAEALTGWQLDEAKNQEVSQVLPLIEEQTQLPPIHPVTLALQQQQTVYLGDRILLLTKDGKTIPVADSAALLRDNNGTITGAVMVFRDDTQRRLKEERNLAAERTRQLEIQMAEMQRLNQLKEDFLAAASHEMRTPLSNIKMAITMLESILDRRRINKTGKPPEIKSVAHYINILRYECERELNLVDDLLNMRFLDADIYPIELTSIRLQDWLLHITEGFQEIVQAQRLILNVEVAKDLPNLVTDLEILTRIVSELLNNACKFTPSGERIAITVGLNSLTNLSIPKTESPEPEISYIQITVSNSGVEIPAKEQQRIFDPFYRIPETESQDKTSIFDANQQIPVAESVQYSGTGLGLALVKKLVEYLKGAIAVSSGQGWTRFTVELPLTLSPDSN